MANDVFGNEMLSDEKRFTVSIVKAAETALPLLEQYRAKNVNKYHRENDLEFSEYTKLERYKNRVRVCDIILPALRGFLMDLSLLRRGSSDEQEID